MPTLNWIEKEKVVNHHLEVPFYTLVHQFRFCEEDGADKVEAQRGGAGQKDDPLSGNMIIHGDNLLALKALMLEYERRVNCIYIDPPYNTDKEKWVYNDNVNDPYIRKWLGGVVGKEGNHLINLADNAKTMLDEYFERLDKIGRYRYFMTYQHQGVEGAVAINKLVELMKRM